MRKAFINTLIELAEQDERVVLLTGDLGFMVLEPFIEKFPDRFYNVGVAEQNMVGIATGLAEAGFIPFVYSIVTFASLRPYEFIRNGPVLHQLPVRIVAVGGGFEYGGAGPTHHGLEDIGIMRVQPGLTVIAPADYEQTKTALLQTWDSPSPIYYRLGKNDQVVIPNLNGDFELGKVQIIQEGKELLLIAMGSITIEVVALADKLQQEGIDATVALVASVNPPPTEDLAQLLQAHTHVMTIEAHYINGGVGSLVAEVIAESGIHCQLQRCGIRTTPDGRSGSETSMHRKHGLDADSLVQTTLNFMYGGERS